MEILDTITIQKNSKEKTIQLFYGDLSAIPAQEEVDLLIVSAFPDDYTPNPGSVIGSLYQQGLSVAELAADKETDLRSQLNCWLSRPLSESEQSLMHFRQLVCFEPHGNTDDPAEAVGNIFRCLNYFALDETFNIVAMPVVASGNQKMPFRKMMPALLKAAIFWLDQGLPLDCIKIAIYKQEDIATAKEVFEAEKNTYLKTTVAAAEKPQELARNAAKKSDHPDVFISYAHVQTAQVQHFVDYLKTKNPDLNVFYDRTSIPPGGLWLRQISEAISKAGRILIFLSPDYSRSPVCWDEFQCAKIREYNSGQSLIQTIYLMTDSELPSIMTLNSWIDCREGDLQKLSTACDTLLEHIAQI